MTHTLAAAHTDGPASAPTGSWRTGASAVRSASTAVARTLARITAPVRSAVTGLGRTVLIVAVVTWIAGWRLGWAEMMMFSAAALVLFLLCTLMIIGRTTLRVQVRVDPLRVVVGQPAAGQVRMANSSRRMLLPMSVELPIGPGTVRFDLPALRGGAEHEELFVAPTERRGVVVIGPATTVRGDPLGLCRRTVPWTERMELFVHPVTVPLEPLSAGLLRDLEGQSTSDVSMSDLAFHTLREYQPGDDSRYIHWRSSAKVGRFMVRQFLDTRRSHIVTVVDGDPSGYADTDEFETAISAAASIAVRVLSDTQDITVIAGAHAAPRDTGSSVLDTFSRAEIAGAGEPGRRLADQARRAVLLAPDASLVLLLTGSRTPFHDLQQSGSHFPPEVGVAALRVDPSASTGISLAGSLTVLTLNRLADLPALLRGAVR